MQIDFFLPLQLSSTLPVSSLLGETLDENPYSIIPYCLYLSVYFQKRGNQKKKAI